MNRKLTAIAIVYIMLILAACLITAHLYERSREDMYGDNNIAVDANEIRNLIESGEYDVAVLKCDELPQKYGDEIKKSNDDKNMKIWIIIPIAISVIGIFSMLFYINNSILKPFSDMKAFAMDVSKGNLDRKLSMDKGNYFGDFTWAFENMRKEIIRSRTAEKNAIENNKTVIATLSHDIKTPMASIRAYAEAFEANMDSTPEKRQKYLTTLMSKCDEVSKLTNDLFIHSISEMNRLEVRKENVDIISFMKKDVAELFAFDEKVSMNLPDKSSYMINADSKRLLQIMENLKSNTEKYAKTRIEITLELLSDSEQLTEAEADKRSERNEHRVRIHFRDFGPGIPEEEIPFITGKFYRGKNCGNENGSGLGLYIVSEIVQKMNGKLTLYNRNPGLDVTIEL